MNFDHVRNLEGKDFAKALTTCLERLGQLGRDGRVALEMHIKSEPHADKGNIEEALSQLEDLEI